MCVSFHIQGADILVSIQNIRNNNGQILFALHNKPEAFPSNPDLASQKAIVIIQKNTKLDDNYITTYTFKNVMPGIYAVATVHDENSNGNLDTFFFRPTEGYGTSNDIRGIFGPPSFQDAKFEVASQNVSIDIRMGY